MALTNEMVLKGFQKAGLPYKYWRQDAQWPWENPSPVRSALLQSLDGFRDALRTSAPDTESPLLKRWFFQGRYSYDAICYFTRGLVMRGVGVKMVTIPDLFDWKNMPDEPKRAWREAKVLAIAGVTDSGVRLPGAEEEILSVQWMIQKALLSDKVVIMQGFCPLANSPWWGEQFKAVAAKHITPYSIQ